MPAEHVLSRRMLGAEARTWRTRVSIELKTGDSGHNEATRTQAEGMFRGAGARGEPADVVAIVEALAMSGERGDRIAAADLNRTLSGIEVAVKRGVPDAMDSRSALRDAGMWQPE